MDTQAGVRICVVGCGHWGKNLLRNFDQIGCLHGFFDAVQGRTETFAAQYPHAHVYQSYEEVLRDCDVQAVAGHAGRATRAYGSCSASRWERCLRGEADGALAEEGDDILKASQETRRIVMVGHLLIYHPAIATIQQLLASGELGHLEYIYSNRLAMGKIRSEENALWSFAPHDISVILRLTGHLPVQVSATGGAYLQPNIADVTVSDLLFDHGTRAHIFVSWLHPYKEQKLVVIGSKKMVVFEETRPSEKLLLYDKNIAEVETGSKLSRASRWRSSIWPPSPCC